MKRLEEYCDQLSEKANDAELFLRFKEELAFLDMQETPDQIVKVYEEFRSDLYALFRYDIITEQDLDVLGDYAYGIETECITRYLNG